MRKMTPLFLVLVMFTPFAGCQNPYEINQENTARILKTLSSDDMQGRGLFTPGIEMAADFIASEFETAGLSPLPGLDNFKQTFNLNSLSISSIAIEINGEIIASDQVFVLLDASEIHWQTGDAEVVNIAAKDNFRGKYGEFLSKGKNLIVLVDETHKPVFSRFQSFYSRPVRKTEFGKESTLIFILTNTTKVRQLKADITAAIETEALTNVIGYIEGNRKNEIVVFSSHYDHLGIVKPVQGDSIANGANDDASGVTAVIELGHYFKTPEKPERSLIFAGFTGEESGGYGSKYFSTHVNPDEIVAMFNLEMIGKPASKKPNSAWITGFEYSDFGKILQQNTDSAIFTFYPDPYPEQNLFYRSDNATLARLGVPAHTISTTPIDMDEDYHQVTDEFGTVNLETMTNTITAVANSSKGIISGKHTPARIVRETVEQ